MSHTNIVHSLKVDKSDSWFGMPGCCPGKQPCIERDLYGVPGLEDVVDKINKIFQVCTALYIVSGPKCSVCRGQAAQQYPCPCYPCWWGQW